MAAVGDATTCCGSTAAAAMCVPSPVTVATLPVARGALDERRLVGTAASDLNTLAGARGGTVGATLRTRRRENQNPPLEDIAAGGAVAYLKLEKRRLLFLGGSTGVLAAADVATGTSPVISAARAGASAARATSLMDCLAAGAPAPAPSAGSSAASAALGEGGAGPHLVLLFLVRRRVLLSRRGRESLLLTQPELLTLLFPALPSPDPLLLLARRPLMFPPLSRARAQAQGVGRSDRAAFTVTICRGRAKDQTSPAHRK
jgi:hypothetical protein